MQSASQYVVAFYSVRIRVQSIAADPRVAGSGDDFCRNSFCRDILQKTEHRKKTKKTAECRQVKKSRTRFYPRPFVMFRY